jgi:DNA polymerase I-like protein with 3'-5' exonuclease and polymerase domains
MFLVNTDESVAKALAFIAANEMLAFDIETTGLNVRKDMIIGFGVSNDTVGFYVPIYYWTGHALINIGTPDAHIRMILEALQGKKLLAFNAAFDMPFTKNYFGIDLLPALDTDVLLLKHTVSEDFPLDLKGIGKMLFGLDAVIEKDAMKASIKANGGTANEFYKADMQLMAEYCVKDCLLTYRIYNYYKPLLVKQGLHKFFYTDEVMPLYREVTIPMELHGVRVDVSYLSQSLAEINQDIAALEDSIQAAIAPHLPLFTSWFLNKDYALKTYTGKVPAWSKKYATQYDAWRSENEGYMFNLQSKHHLKKLLFDTLKETPLSRTETGLPQVDNDFLDSISNKYEWVQNLIVYNKLNKLKATYIENLLENQEDGIYYPRFSQHRTTSGRYSSDMQQLPRPIELIDPNGKPVDPRIVRHTNRIREFIITREGHYLVGTDYNSLEPRIFSHVSNDEALIDIFKSGKDFYSLIAINTEGLRGVSADKSAPNYLGKVNKAARQKSKMYSLGLAYGLSAYKLKFELNISQEDAQVLVDNYFKAFPLLKQAIENTHREMQTQGFVRSQVGRIRHLQQAKDLYQKYGAAITDDLMLYKLYSSVPSVYEKAKQDRRIYKNLANNAFNFKIQSLAASIMNRAMITMSKEFKAYNVDAIALLTIHDEVVVECAESDLQVTKDIIQNCMENVIQLSLKLEAIPQEGMRYADTK